MVTRRDEIESRIQGRKGMCVLRHRCSWWMRRATAGAGGTNGLTLTELLISVAIVGILAAAAVSNYGVAVQRARWDAARSVLLKIYDGEQNYYANVGDGRVYPAVPTGAGGQPNWRNNLNLDDPNQDPALGYTIVVAVGPPATFTARATYNATTQTVTQDRVLSQTSNVGCPAGIWCRP